MSGSDRWKARHFRLSPHRVRPDSGDSRVLLLCARGNAAQLPGDPAEELIPLEPETRIAAILRRWCRSDRAEQWSQPLSQRSRQLPLAEARLRFLPRCRRAQRWAVARASIRRVWRARRRLTRAAAKTKKPLALGIAPEPPGRELPF